MTRPLLVPALVAVAGLLAVAGSAQAQSLEDRLRSQLVATTTQLQQAQAAQASLQADKAAAEKARDALKARLATTEAQLRAAKRAPPVAQPATDQQAAQLQQLTKANSEATTQLSDARTQVEQLGRELTALRAEHDRLDATAQAGVASLTACKAKNAQAIAVAKDILAAYDRASVLGVAMRKEPFTRLKRVQIEQLEQDFGDRIYDSRLDTQPRAKPSAAAPQSQSQSQP
jgi:chromosome segregation ATPase